MKVVAESPTTRTPTHWPSFRSALRVVILLAMCSIPAGAREKICYEKNGHTSDALDHLITVVGHTQLQQYWNEPTRVGVSLDVIASLRSEIYSLLMDQQFGQLEQALEVLKRKNEKDLSAIRLSEKIYSSIASRLDILPVLDQWCAASPGRYESFLLRGNARVTIGWSFHESGEKNWNEIFLQNFRLAKVDLERAYELDASEPYTAALMIDVCRALGESKEHMEMWFQRAITADPTCEQAYLNKMYYLLPRWHGSVDEVSAYMADVYKNAPEGSEVWFRASEGLLMQDLRHRIHHSAYASFHETIHWRQRHEFPGSALSHYLSAVRMLNDNQPIESTKHLLRMGLELEPHYAGLLRIRGQYHEALGNLELALADLNQSINLLPDESRALNARGQLYRKMGKPDLAILDFEHALKVSPGDETAIANLQELRTVTGGKLGKLQNWLKGLE